MPRELPALSPEQVIKLQDALLANADALLSTALLVLEEGNVGLARSLAILGMEESGKAIALHQRRVSIAYESEGSPFVNDWLQNLWASHQVKLHLVHSFLVEERYWFGTHPSRPEDNEADLGTIKRWVQRHDKLKLRGFYVDIDKIGNVLEPSGVSDQDSLARVIEHIHQIGWQLRLGEHIEAQGQATMAKVRQAMSNHEIEELRKSFEGVDLDDDLVSDLCAVEDGTTLHNDAYRLQLPDQGSSPFRNVGKPGHEAETRELLRLSEGLDKTDRSWAPAHSSMWRAP